MLQGKILLTWQNGAEDAGFDSLWVLERLIWPINPLNPYLDTKDGKFPEDWQYIFDPLETLTFVAAITNKIALGTSIIDILFHNPVILSRRFATLDVLSSGRAIGGFGKRANEYVQIVKKIWTDDVVEFKGEYYNIPASKIGPKPIQQPHPPIYLGGYSQNTFARIAKHANGWICTVRDSLSEVESNIDKIRHECYKINRDAKDIQIVAIVYPNVIESHIEREMTLGQGQQRHLFSGTTDQVGQDFQEVKKIEIDHVILNYNRSIIGDNTSKIIEVSKELSRFIK